MATALRRGGAAVTVVDAGAPAGGTSGATFSWLNSCGKQPRAYHDLNVAGMQAHRALADEVPDGGWYHGGGNLEWSDDRDALRAKVDGVLDYGYAARWLTRSQVLELEPDLSPDALPDDGIAFFPDEGWLDPGRMIGHLLGDVEVVRDDAVTALDVADGLVRAVVLASGRRLPADAVVNCAGPRAAEIAAFAGLTLPMRNTSGVLVSVTGAAASVARVVHAPGVHVRPDGAGRMLLHAPEHDADTALAEGRALWPGLADATVADVRTGERPIPGDGLPVLGRSTDVPNFHFAVSHSGATLCLHAGALVAGEVLGEDHADVLGPFRFERFG